MIAGRRRAFARALVSGLALLACGGAQPSPTTTPRAETPRAAPELGARLAAFSGVWVRVGEDGRRHGVVVFPDGDAFDMKLAGCHAAPIDARPHRVVLDGEGAFLVIDGQKVAQLHVDGDTMTLASRVGDTSRRATASRSVECAVPSTKPSPGAPQASDEHAPPPPPAVPSVSIVDGGMK